MLQSLQPRTTRSVPFLQRSVRFCASGHAASMCLTPFRLLPGRFASLQTPPLTFCSLCKMSRPLVVLRAMLRLCLSNVTYSQLTHLQVVLTDEP